jgi:hypothetical protein
MLIVLPPGSRAVIGLGVLRSRAAEPRLVALFAAEQVRRVASKSGEMLGRIHRSNVMP